MADSRPVQSRLLTIARRSSLEVEERLDLGADALHPGGDDLGASSGPARRSCRWGRRSDRWRRPTRASGDDPARCSRRAVRICTRLPMCRLGAVGSKPT